MNACQPPSLPPFLWLPLPLADCQFAAHPVPTPDGIASALLPSDRNAFVLNSLSPKALRVTFGGENER